MKYLNYVLSGFVAGILIAFAGTIYFMCGDNHVVGALLFTFGLFMIMVLGCNLYTGKIGYMIENKNYLEVLFSLIGNFFGTVFIGLLLNLTKYKDYLYIHALPKMEGKTDFDINSLISILVLSIFCGALMFLAYAARKKLEDKLGQYIALFLCVMVFILCGFEHSIANMYYITVAHAWSFTIIIPLIVMIVGNAIGGIGTWAITTYLDKNMNH